MKFKDIPQMTRDGNYRVHVDWAYIEEWIEKERGDLNLNLDPDYQRAHVWTEEQQRRYVEFVLRGGQGSSEIRFNCVGWMMDFRGPFEIVDGKQRLEAVRAFLRDDLGVFDQRIKRSGFEGHLRSVCCRFHVHINDLETRKEVLQWYLDINAGGVAHTNNEIKRVRELLEKEDG